MAEKLGVKFNLFSKVSVNGEEALPLFKYLKASIGIEKIETNFLRFLITRDGEPLTIYGSQQASKLESDLDKIIL